MLVTKFRKWVAAFVLCGALGLVAVMPVVLFAVNAMASGLEEPNHYSTRISANRPAQQPPDTSYMWLISIATPIAVIASAWGAVRSVQASHAETLREIKLENEATNEKVDAVADKVEQLGKDLAYIQGKFDSHSDD